MKKWKKITYIIFVLFFLVSAAVMHWIIMLEGDGLSLNCLVQAVYVSLISMLFALFVYVDYRFDLLQMKVTKSEGW